MDSQTVDVVVIGAGQAGLAAGYFLKRAGLDFIILEGNARVGDVWRDRWDSLRLFTPAKYSALPGLAFPAPAGSFPGKDAFADYLASYAQHFQLPVRTGIQVLSIHKAGSLFEVQTSDGPVQARAVVVAAGPNSAPNVPDVALDLDEQIQQLHSSGYSNPAGLPAGDVLVVGAGTSGAEIALELAHKHRSGKVYLAGRPTPHIPDAVFRYAGPLYWRLVNSLLTLDTRPGRKVAQGFHRRGAPLIRVSMKDVERAGVIRLPRLTGASAGKPVFAVGTPAVGTSDGGTSDGGTSDGGTPAPGAAPDTAAGALPGNLRTVIWATGFRPDFGWIEGLPVDDLGWPVTARGVVAELPGLYFVGMPFQYALTSAIVGGVGRDAEYVVEHLVADHALTSTIA
ncbi:flavin-containing monooxygenase [Pseudarthrobacter sp. YS3]|uniref:flavin-containing monooxygenase n=1 Tax=Pseudarthrobacter sp. YS3 TaxID=3453718 RepID=UPI003EEEB350